SASFKGRGALEAALRQEAVRGRAPDGSFARSLAAKAELLDQRAVAVLVLLLDVVEKRTALRHELQETTTGMVVLRVGLEVLGQIVDPLGQNGDLHLGGAGIACLLGEFFHQRGLALSRNRHRLSFQLGLRVDLAREIEGSRSVSPGAA